MTEYNFEIIGNQENPKGNPIPYHRTTQKGLWDKTARRYYNWKLFVLEAFWKQTKGKLYLAKPVKKTDRGRLEIMIYFGNEGHADPDNIAKGLLDALCDNDKHMDVTTSHSCGNKAGRIVARITLEQ